MQVKPDEWRLWGALRASGKYRHQDILVLIEISADSGFSRMVHRGKAIANKSNHFAIHYTYRPRHLNTPFFYRFKAIRTNRAADGVNHERKVIVSDIGEMMPWTR